MFFTITFLNLQYKTRSKVIPTRSTHQCSHFIPPENIRKPLVFCCFQGIWNGNIGQSRYLYSDNSSTFVYFLCCEFTTVQICILSTDLLDFPGIAKKLLSVTASKVSKYGVISSRYFPVFRPNAGKYRPEITTYLGTFQAVCCNRSWNCIGCCENLAGWITVFYLNFFRIIWTKLVDYLYAYNYCVKSIRIWSFSGPYIPVIRLNTDIYSVDLRIQSECGNIGTRKTSNTDFFYRVSYPNYLTNPPWLSYRKDKYKKNFMEICIFLSENKTVENQRNLLSVESLVISLKHEIASAKSLGILLDKNVISSCKNAFWRSKNHSTVVWVDIIHFFIKGTMSPKQILKIYFRNSTCLGFRWLTKRNRNH